MKIAGADECIAFFVDGPGQEEPLMGCALATGVLMPIVAIVIVKDPPDSAKGISSAGTASVAIIYLKALASNFAWSSGNYLSAEGRSSRCSYA